MGAGRWHSRYRRRKPRSAMRRAQRLQVSAERRRPAGSSAGTRRRMSSTIPSGRCGSARGDGGVGRHGGASMALGFWSGRAETEMLEGGTRGAFVPAGGSARSHRKWSGRIHLNSISNQGSWEDSL
ncbi:hypothetical protein SEVIR_2G012625v4 [Setaria viridis]